MKLFSALSSGMIPVIILILVVWGVKNKTPVYDCFISGAWDGLKTVARICPTLIGLMIGVSVLRASGFLDAVTQLLEPAALFLHFPGELLPCTIVRMFSSSAATGLILDIFREYGTDSYVGFLASVSNACTETIFYTMSVYFLTAGVKKTRWTLAGAFVSTFAGIAVSTLLTEWMVG